ncbi:MAG: hypothetical protein HQK57_09630 [Deltaproteobacteria bacterium]|nr:hypothetical protein [Deltaproteobacteria bacterium]
MDKMLLYIADNQLGDVSSILGLLISLVGFTVTIISVIRSRKAAELAYEAASAMRKSMVHHDSIANCSEAISIMSEIKRLQRVGAWDILPDRYSVIRGLLVSLKDRTPCLKNDHNGYLQNAIQHFSNLEHKIEGYISQKKRPPDEMKIKINQILSKQIDRLHEIEAAIRQNTDGE